MLSAFESFQQTRYFRCLDGLRCASIFAVTAHHTGLVPWGVKGVTLFFAISGFLITTLLLRERDKFGSISLRDFYARRSLRIFPLYYAVLLFYCITTWFGGRDTPVAREFFHNLRFFFSYTANWGVRPGAHFYEAWSLATEEQFYLFWPFVVAFSRRRSTPIFVITGVLIYVMVMRALLTAGTVNFGAAGNRAAISMSPAICLGCILAYALFNEQTFHLLLQTLGSVPGGLLILAGVIASLAIRRTPQWCDEFLAAAVVGCAVIRPWRFLTLLLANPIVRFFGTVSYGMYLFNILAVRAAERTFAGTGLLHAIWAFLIAGAIAAISYFTYERAFLRLKSRYSLGRTVPIERIRESTLASA